VTQSETQNYGFVINNRSCIGCHACSTACKSENEVPLGVYRTWVKYTEVGEYPNARRQFQVTRCNHCANPPCVRICPVTAMYQRDDGIVEFDPEACIGCKACMQACPYDAIHIDPDSGTASKCHYCAHRTEVGLEPACVVVCPTHSIIAGDMNDPNSEISKVLAKERVTVRKPEQGTSPKLFYIDGDDVTMHPTATERTPETYMWADTIEPHGAKAQKTNGQAHKSNGSTGVAQLAATKRADSGTPIREPQTQGLPQGGPIQLGQGRRAEHMVQVAYNAQHEIPWHWPVPAYLVTKGIAAGVFLLLALAAFTGLSTLTAPVASVGALISVVFLAATTGLLVFDLERPERFLNILFRPQWNSWLARGALLLIGFSGIATVWWALETAAWIGWMDLSVAEAARPWLLGVGTPFAIGTAIYTAFLFGQAEGRDLWQSTLLPLHLVVQAAMMGGAVVSIMGAVMAFPEGLMSLAVGFFAVSLVVDLFVTLLGEFGMPHASEVAARAAHEISHGAYKGYFWGGAIVLGHLVPLGLLLVGAPIAAAVAGVCAIIGLYLFEHAFVMAPQEVPNS
jgi:Fe-S-cluster-containing dehydrogenase component/formate-dependent nitrite reductase membrane component NrfD